MFQTCLFFFACHVSGSWHNLPHPLGRAHPRWTLQDLLEKTTHDPNPQQIHLLFRYAFHMLKKLQKHGWRNEAFSVNIISPLSYNGVMMSSLPLGCCPGQSFQPAGFIRANFSAKPREGKQPMPLTYAVANILSMSSTTFSDLCINRHKSCDNQRKGASSI